MLDGRLFIEGVDMLRAVDIYTGRVLWEAKLPGLGDFYNNTSHQPGANGAGTNFVSMSDGIYVTYGDACLRLDPVTGKTLSKFTLPAAPGTTQAPRWSYLNVVGRYLIAGAEPLFEAGPAKPATRNGDDDDRSAAVLRLTVDDYNLSSSRRLIVLDRFSGAELWSVAAHNAFRHNGVCAGGGRLYCIDRVPGNEVGRLKRRGVTEIDPARIETFDLATRPAVVDHRSKCVRHVAELLRGARHAGRVLPGLARCLVGRRQRNTGLSWR